MFDSPTRESDKERVRDASDIVRVIGEHIALKAKGKEYLGLCPFHDDHNPSMHVVPHKQIYKCFSCDASGDVFSFIQNFHKMTFPEALEYLAGRAGIELTRRQPAGDRPAGSVGRRELIEANGAAADFFRAILRHEDHGRPARATIERRGISAEMAERFGLGASPDRWDGLLTVIRNKGLREEAFLQAGLLKPRRTEGGHYDAFRNRLMFPITNQAGQVVAFGGRKIAEEDEPKYLNSADSPAFDKSRTLYGLSQALSTIRRERLAIVCEGYTDVIACHQAGLANAVATLGTALTSAHAEMLERLDARVVLLFDGDEAGERAADRAVEVVFDRPIDVRIALLSTIGDAKDPDELLKREDGADQLRGAIGRAPDVLEYRFDRLRERLAGAGVAEIERAFQAEIERLVELGLGRVSPVRRQLMIRRLNEITGLSDRVIAGAIPAGRGARRTPAIVETRPAARAASPAEHLLGCVLNEGDLLSTLDQDGHALLAPERFEREDVAGVAAIVLDLAGRGESPGLTRVLDATEDEAIKRAAVGLSERVDHETERDRDRRHAHWHECLRTARRESVRSDGDTDAISRIEQLRAVMAQEGGDNRVLPRHRQDAGGRRP